MLVKTYGAAVQGISAIPITMEVNISSGIRFFLVGLPDNSVKESHERIVSALTESGFKFPKFQITINMAPADIRKEGAAYDLPLAVGILAASEKISAAHLSEYMLMGELSLDGTLRPITGVLPMAIKAREQNFKGLIVPARNAREAAVVNRLEVYGAENLRQVVDFLNDRAPLTPTVVDTRSIFFRQHQAWDVDFADVKGQENVKRALEVAAAGGHNLIMIGPPGAGKSMMAKRLPTILPPLTLAESLETTKIHSVAGKMDRDASLIAVRPFRAPHHTISNIALVGGGSVPQPGEISLAHNGVLFLDELPEFKRDVLEVLRQPLEDRRISISRTRLAAEYPANFMLVASMNPCPCGYYNHPDKPCTCTELAIRKYLGRISGPLLDRIDIQVEITPVPFEQLRRTRAQSESSAAIRERVIRARNIQSERYKDFPEIHCNAQMTSSLMEQYARLDDEGASLLHDAMRRFNLSARAYDRILKVARTIADLASSPSILPSHLYEAIGYRSLDRSTWGRK